MRGIQTLRHARLSQVEQYQTLQELLAENHLLRESGREISSSEAAATLSLAADVYA